MLVIFVIGINFWVYRLGHASLQTSLIYLKVLPDTQGKVVRIP